MDRELLQTSHITKIGGQYFIIIQLLNIVIKIPALVMTKNDR